MALDAQLGEDLAKSFSNLDLESEIPPYPSSHPNVNVIDIYRNYLTITLHKVTGIDEDIIYPALQWTQTLDKGDLNLAVPRLRVKGSSPTSLAQEWAEKVSLLIAMRQRFS